MSNTVAWGRTLRSFNVIDDYNREMLFMEADYSLKSTGAIWVPQRLVNRCGKPETIRMNNRPGVIAKIAQAWRMVNDIEFQSIQPEKPTQNVYRKDLIKPTEMPSGTLIHSIRWKECERLQILGYLITIITGHMMRPPGPHL